MKIISSFTDFYEYDCYRYGEPDQSLIWKRETESIEYNKDLKKLLDKYFISSYNMQPSYHFKKLVARCTWKYNFDISVIDRIVGIYPFIYYIPAVFIKGALVHKYSDIKLSGKDSLKIINEFDSWKEIVEKYGARIKDFNIFPRFLIEQSKNIIWAKGRELDENFNIIKDEEIFNYLKTPIFFAKKEFVFGDEDVEIELNPYLVSKDFQSYYPNILNDRDIYNDIEQFLWSQKTEPISEQSNNGKIISHGFDLKTSFRNVK
jgi:hypothetical protein